MRIALIATVCCLLLVSCKQAKSPVGESIPHQPEISLAGELKVFSDVSNLPSYLNDSLTAQVSTYDPTWGNNDGFTGKYSFVRKNPDSTLVLFETTGKGVIHRIATSSPREDTLDFYIDDPLLKTFSIKYSDLFSGEVFPFVAPLCGRQAGGNYCYLPIPFAKSCKIVLRAKKTQFHQIQYSLFPKDVAVKSFNPNLSQEEKGILSDLAALWSKPGKTVEDFVAGTSFATETHDFSLQPGKTEIIFDHPEGGRILGLEIEPAEVFAGLSKNIDLRITWDDEKNPAVLCPAADFFGYAFGAPSMQSLLLGSKGNVHYCYIPMPYDKHARVELIFRTDSVPQEPVYVRTKVFHSTLPRDPLGEGKFHAAWNHNVRSAKGKPHVFLDIAGKGHYVGTMLQAQGRKAGMTSFFEGDDSTAIDGVFRMHGIGSEDYFNGGWYAVVDRWEGKVSLPLSGALDYSLPYCRTGGYRLFLSDKIPFRKSFFQSIEHGPVGNTSPVDYLSLALYYSDTPATHSPQPKAETARVYIPDTLFLYPQLMTFNLWNSISLKPDWKYDTGGDNCLITADDESTLRISLAELPKGSYKLFADIARIPEGCEFSVWQRQTKVSPWLSAQSPKEQRVPDLFISNLETGDFKNTITFHFKTSKNKNQLYLNRLIFIRQ